MVAEVHNLNILPLFNVSALFGFIASISTTSATLGTLVRLTSFITSIILNFSSTLNPIVLFFFFCILIYKAFFILLIVFCSSMLKLEKLTPYASFFLYLLSLIFPLLFPLSYYNFYKYLLFKLCFDWYFINKEFLFF